MKAQKLNQRQGIQTLYLSRFDFTLKHMAGKSVRRVDSLSRRLDQAEGIERDKKNQGMLKKNWLEIRAMKKGQLLIEGPKEDIIEKIKKSEVRDNKVIKAVEEMKKAEVKILRNEKWQVEDKLVLKKEKVYVLRDEKLRLEIIQLHYNTLIVGHERQWKTVELITRNYWWSEVTKEVKQNVEGCDQYQCQDR